MDMLRLRVGEWVTGLCGAALFVLLFLPWYEVQRPVGGVNRLGTDVLDITPFEAYDVVDLLMVLLAGLAIGLVILTAAQRSHAPGIAADTLLMPIALILAVVVLLRVLNLPGELEPAPGGIAVVDQTIWAWLGVIAAFGVFGGALLAMRDERLSEPGRLTDSSGSPVASQPEAETLPPPSSEAPG